MTRVVVETVVKLGGGVLGHAEYFDRVLAAIGEAARERALLVVPGGGPFADAVRDVDRRFHISDDAAHWMAVLAMDQYAHLVASRVSRGVVVATANDIARAFDSSRLPVLAPSQWLRDADPLPHSWNVTSDSIAAWVAGEVEARQLILVKPPRLRPSDRPGFSESSPRAPDRELVDPYFARALPTHVTHVVVAADEIDHLRSALRA